MWDSSKKIEVFGARSSQLSEEDIISKYNKKASRNEKSILNIFSSIKGLQRLLPGSKNGSLRKFCNVEVNIVDIECVSQYLRDFYVFLARLDNVDLYDN